MVMLRHLIWLRPRVGRIQDLRNQRVTNGWSIQCALLLDIFHAHTVDLFTVMVLPALK